MKASQRSFNNLRRFQRSLLRQQHLFKFAVVRVHMRSPILGAVYADDLGYLEGEGRIRGRVPPTLQ